jgi:hypothetical protein
VEIRFFAEGADSARVELEHPGLQRHGAGWEKLRAGVAAPGEWGAVLEQFVKAAGS